jgi:membrane-bound serine protease (ClpP class)
MKVLWPVALQAMAFGVAFAEVIVPSFGILLILCIALGGYSWFVIATQLPHAARFWFGIADLIAIPLFIKFSFSYLGRSAISHRTDLGKGSGLDAVDRDLQRHVGVTALVDATLRPTGRIRIGEDTFEAQTGGDWVEKGARVKVVSVSGSRFHVEKIPDLPNQ